jgi:DNA-binding IclR family transcriptional regulator
MTSLSSSSSSNAERAARVMIAIGAWGIDGVSLKLIAEELGEAKPAVHRTLTALARFGFVESRGRGRYRLGAAIFALAKLEGTATDRIARWRPIVTAIAARHGYTVYLLGRAGMDAVVLDMQMGGAPLQTLTRGVGARLPLGLGPGPAAILSTLDPATRELILDQNAANYEALGYKNAHIRRFVRDAVIRGYAFDRADFVADCGGVALPIRDRDGLASAAITVSAPLSYLTDERVAGIVAELQQAIATIEQLAPPIRARDGMSPFIRPKAEVV